MCFPEGPRHEKQPQPEVVDTVPLLREKGIARVLDLGCGVGRHALLLADEGFSVCALDGSASGIAFSRQAAQDGGLAIEFGLGLMTELPYGDQVFGAVVAWNVIYHGDETVIRRTLDEVRRVLQPGGVFVGTMLSKRNSHFGVGREVAPDTYVMDGSDLSDKAHPHYYCDAVKLLDLFAGFEPLTLFDRQHHRPGSYHWHLVAERTAP